MRIAILAGMLWTAQQAAGWQVEDQFGRQHTDAELRGKVVLVVGGNRAAAPVSMRWPEEIRRQLGDGPARNALVVLRVADLRGVPRMARGMVRSRMPKGDSAQIMLDFQGTLVRNYQFLTDSGNCVVLGADGRVLHRFAGARLPQAEATRVTAAIRAAVASAAP